MRLNILNAFSEEDAIVLAPPTNLIDEAKEIAQNTKSDEKFTFALQYNASQKNHLLSMLNTVGAIVEKDDTDKNIFAIKANMKQLSFIKRLNCVERIKSDKGSNPFLAKSEAKRAWISEATADTKGVNTTQAMLRTQAVAFVAESTKLTANTSATLNSENDNITIACVDDSTSTCCPSNADMENAKTVSDESYTIGAIECPGGEQWFKFIATKTGQYTILTMSYLDTIGTLYDCYGNQIVEVDDHTPSGNIDFRITQNLTAGNTYYVKVRIYGDDTGNYTLRITDRVYANYVTISPKTIALKQGVLYELPITPNYVYKGYNGASRIPGLSISINPANVSEQKVDWWDQYGDVLECSFGWDDDGDRYIHVRALNPGSENLYARDWNENGKRDACTVTVVPAYETMLKEKCGFSSEEANLILKLYGSVDAIFSSESALQKAWRCARVLSEFSYDALSYKLGIPYNKWNIVAGSVTDNENRESYFINTLGYTESEYNTLHDGLLRNKEVADNYHNIIDFTHMQYALAARLAYTLNKIGILANIGAGLDTDNFKVYTDEEISYLGGWLGDATLITGGKTILKNDDYMADLDAENIYHLILQGNSAIAASNTYYSNMNFSNTRADIFLQHIPYNTVEEKIFNELLDNQDDGYDTIKSNYPDTYNFLKSLNDRLMTLAEYQS